MVARALLLSTVLLVTLFLACGGGEEASSGVNRTPARTATPTPTGAWASVEPRSGPPGTRVTVAGSGWQPGAAIVLMAITPPGQAGNPYATATAAADGSFASSFLLEKLPAGGELSVGRLDLVARSEETEVRLPFLVEVRRPVRQPGVGG